MKTKIVYKVIWKRNNELVSCNQSDYFPFEFRTRYKLNEITHPNIKGTKLFCFDSLDHAQNFIEFYCWAYQSELKIYKAEAYDVYYPKTRYIVSLLNIKYFWNMIKKHKKEYRNDIQQVQKNHVPIPEGSMVCSSLKLLKEI